MPLTCWLLTPHDLLVLADPFSRLALPLTWMLSARDGLHLNG